MDKHNDTEPAENANEIQHVDDETEMMRKKLKTMHLHHEAEPAENENSWKSQTHKLGLVSWNVGEQLRKKKHKLHDQEIGAILDFNPSDCSHWKKGEKNIKSIY